MADDGYIIFIGELKNAFWRTLNRKYSLTTARSGKQAITASQDVDILAVVIDAPSMRTKGTRIVRALRDAVGQATPIILIYEGTKPAANNLADRLISQTTSARKFANIVSRVIDISRVSQRTGDLLTCGPFALDVERRVLIAYDVEHVLTPKQAELMAHFLAHPGQVLERKGLMKAVWDTDYTGDTRTLNVHIRWLRKILEHDGQPRVLKTVRGVGYKFELD